MLQQSLTEYRREHQRKEDRREFELYDPDSKRKDKPARENDEDPRSTIATSSAFSFTQNIHKSYTMTDITNVYYTAGY